MAEPTPDTEKKESQWPAAGDFLGPYQLRAVSRTDWIVSIHSGRDKWGDMRYRRCSRHSSLQAALGALLSHESVELMRARQRCRTTLDDLASLLMQRIRHLRPTDVRIRENQRAA